MPKKIIVGNPLKDTPQTNSTPARVGTFGQSNPIHVSTGYKSVGSGSRKPLDPSSDELLVLAEYDNTQQQHAEAQQQKQQQQIEQLTSMVRQQSLTIDKMQANAGERNSSGISSTSNDNCCCVLLFNNSWCVSLRRVFNQFNDPTNTPNALEDKSGKFLGIWEPAQNFGIKYCWCCGPRVGCVSNFSHINIFQSHSNCFKVFSPKHFTNIIIPHLHLIFQK